MTWKKTTFERQKLFDEIWATPITKLAKEYGLSDVGLRKICLALDMPLPPRGYWAKLAAGKAIPKPQLHKTALATEYESDRYVTQVDESLEERFMQARDSATDAVMTDTSDYVPPLDSQAFYPQAKLVVRALKSAKLDEGVLTSSGETWADISVSEELKERALLLVDRFAHELEGLNAKFENSQPALPLLRRGGRRESGIKRNCFTLHGQHFFVRISERIKQELVPPPPAKPQQGRLHASARQPAWKYRPPEYRYIPTGRLYTSIVDIAGYYERYKVEDTPHRTIEFKVRKAIRWIEDAALRRNIENEVRAERELVRRMKAQEWEATKVNKGALLAKLAAFEKMAKDLDRARSLRRLMDEIVASQAAPEELVRNLELMALMADWIDPLVKAPWPEVDTVADKNPHGNFW